MGVILQDTAIWQQGNFANDFGAQLGEKLRQRRKVVGKTLQQVAKETGLSVSFVSQVERGQSTPSLTSFYKLAKALDASMEALLELAVEWVPITRGAERQVFNLGDSNRTYEHLSPGFPGAAINAVMVHRPPNSVSELFSHEGEEFVYLLKGEVLYELDDEKYRLVAGDTIHFKSERHHRSEVLSADGAIELWIGTLPLYEREEGTISR